MNMKRLYEAADSFRKLAPWEWMDDDRIFGVKNPETGVIDYCGVLGALHEVFALVVYEGPEGLHGYLKLLSGELGEMSLHGVEYQRALMASFDDRRDLAPEDLAVIRSLNLKFRGKNGWPMFRHHLPGYLPWFVTESQAGILATCLEQALDVLPRYRENPGLLQDPTSNSHLVRVFGSQQSQAGWRDEILPAPPPPSKDSSTVCTVPIDEVGIARIRRQQRKRRGVWEIGFCYAPVPIREQCDERPYFPRLLGIIDQATGLILAVLLQKQGKHVRVFRDQILSCLEQRDFLPEHLLVDHDEAAALAEPIAAALGIALHRVRELPAFAEALDGLIDTMR